MSDGVQGTLYSKYRHPCVVIISYTYPPETDSFYIFLQLRVYTQIIPDVMMNQRDPNLDAVVVLPKIFAKGFTKSLDAL